ncbi:hypothetical protein M441DRAFT_459864 [Trichoderma asperellum CBS 433.97]|uniref:Peptidase S8/S53 domain-containing protein n=1 Tax=Trichoderma asperellum (strain ATCC 204424 / CBS 433.97 / NBRC 101777) TaxID=1042311 RepID=A0A2T3Z2S1_TRIA4|nr:hypothetical protein M441DRAFT_459864 [Trichoderma asperellum CBS 433.97]PTB39093.1 hypothetical protein M441DRAFT_459864 [Trichoderma asperellum CBS 433.97]
MRFKATLLNVLLLSLPIAVYQVRKEFNSAKFFYGLSLTLTDNASDKTDLLKVSDVKSVWPVRVVPRPNPFAAAPPASLSNGTLPHIKGSSDVNRPLKMASVDKVHSQGIKGKGVKIGIIDTGVDYLHPSLGGGFGPGIIGMTDASNQGFGFVGVAPEAIIGMYRVFGCEGDSGDDVIMATMQQAAEDGVHLISMSLGSITYWEKASPYVPLAQSIVESVSAPGLAPEVLAVGSAESKIYPTVYKAENNLGRTLEYISVLPFISDKPITIFEAGSGLNIPITEEQTGGCDPSVWTAAQSAITDGAQSCFNLQYAQLLAMNVTTVIYYTDDPDTPILLAEAGTTDPFNILFLGYNQSQQVVKDIASLGSRQKYTLVFKSSMIQDSPNPAGHTIDYFSSIGPTIEMTQKPQLSSSGGNILSTYPLSAGGYAVLSGTSMATPFTAGQPELSIADITSLIQSTAVPMKAQNLNIISSVTQQGVAADSQISPSQLSLLDSPKPAKHSITIKNTSSKAKVYSISCLGASYIRTVTNFTGGHEAKFAAAQFSKSKLSLQPGQSTTVEVQFTAPEELHPESEPIYSGYVKIATNSSSYVVPYLGVPYTRNDVDYLGHNTTAWVGNDRPFVGPDVTKPGESNIGNYSILGRDGSVPADLLVPITGFIVVQPTNLVRLDAVPVNTSFVPTFYGFDPSIKSDVTDVDLPLLEGFLGVPTYGILSAWGIGDIPPGIDPRTLVAWPNPNVLSGFILEWPLFMFENGTDFNITSGPFRPLLRILRYGNNGTSPDDHESWLGPIINAHTT